MSTFDIILLVIIGGFGLFGLWFGFIHTLGSMLGTVLGIYLATRYYEPLAAWLMHVTGWSGNVSKVVMFAVAFILINRLVGLAFWTVDKFLKVITKLPFIGSINRLLGLLLGIAEGAITIGVILYFVEMYPISDKVNGLIFTSAVAPYTIPMAEVFLPLLPKGLNVLESTVDYVEAVVK